MDASQRIPTTKCGTALPPDQATDLLHLDEVRKHAEACQRERTRRLEIFEHLLTDWLLELYPAMEMTIDYVDRQCCYCDRLIPATEPFYKEAHGKPICNSGCVREDSVPTVEPAPGVDELGSGRR